MEYEAGMLTSLPWPSVFGLKVCLERKKNVIKKLETKGDWRNKFREGSKTNRELALCSLKLQVVYILK
jgi:hypothetical protein